MCQVDQRARTLVDQEGMRSERALDVYVGIDLHVVHACKSEHECVHFTCDLDVYGHVTARDCVGVGAFVDCSIRKALYIQMRVGATTVSWHSVHFFADTSD